VRDRNLIHPKRRQALLYHGRAKRSKPGCTSIDYSSPMCLGLCAGSVHLLTPLGRQASWFDPYPCLSYDAVDTPGVKPMEERLQKILARAGLASRRHCEELIREGRVAVNGQVAQLGQKADPRRDRIVVDGRPVEVGLPRTYVALHKPLGVLSSEDDGSRDLTAARGLVSLPGRLFPVGRLDLQSEGLILLTDDGELANLLTHPRYEHTKEYHVQVEGHPDAETIERWQQGILLDEKRTAPARVSMLPASARSGVWPRCWATRSPG